MDVVNVLFFSRLSSKSKSVDKSDEELQFPKELMEDWSTMEVCVDCKKFISEIINSSRHSLVLANKRARLKRKTQSFYVSSAGPSEYCPSERTISEVWAPCICVQSRIRERTLSGAVFSPQLTGSGLHEIRVLLHHTVPQTEHCVHISQSLVCTERGQ